MKNTIKKLALVAGVFALSQTVNAQTEKGFYVAANAGFAGNMGATTNLGNANSTQQANGSTTYEITKIGLGKGVNFGIAAGYMFNKNIGAELGINYLIGGKTETTRTSLNGSVSKNEISGKMLQFKPTLVLTAGYSKINPYAKFGITLGQASAEATSTQTFGSNSNKRVSEFEGGMSVGIHSGLGLNYAITNKVTLFGEVLYTGVTFRPETSTVTSATENGVNVLNTLSVIDINTVFVDYNTNEPQDNNNIPYRGDAIDIPFNNIGLNVGVKFAL